MRGTITSSELNRVGVSTPFRQRNDLTLFEDIDSSKVYSTPIFSGLKGAGKGSLIGLIVATCADVTPNDRADWDLTGKDLLHPGWHVVNTNIENNVDGYGEYAAHLKLSDEIRKINNDRITMLIKKHSSKQITREDEARLVMLQQKILALYPRVQKTDVDKLETLSNKLEKFKKDNEEVQKLLS